MLLDGCALMLTDPPPPNYRELAHFDCDASYAPAIVDTTLALAFAAGAVALAANRDSVDDTRLPVTSSIIGVSIWSAVYGLSAGLGYHNASSCRDARAQVEGPSSASPAVRCLP
jgi:hypothetical protein